MPSSRAASGQDDVPAGGTVHASASTGRAGSLPAAASAWQSLAQAHVAVARALQAAVSWEDLSPAEFDVLTALARTPGQCLRLTELNRQVLLTQPGLSRLVTRLTDAGLVVRCPEPHDGRGTLARLTPSGAARQRRVAEAHARAVHRLVGAGLSDAELSRLGALAEQLRSAVPPG